MDLGNATKYFGRNGTIEACSRAYRPNIKINKLHEDAHLPTYGSKKCCLCRPVCLYRF